MLAVTEVKLDSFQIVPVATENSLSLAMSGTGDMSAVAPLKACLTEVRQTAKATPLALLEVDIRKLYLLNSSCIKAFVHFIYLNQTEGPKLKVKYIVDSNISWQARALAALNRMAPELVSIETR